MQVKKLVDGIRRDFDLDLTLNRSRDLISRLIFGRPYSAAMAAERAGKLAQAQVDEDFAMSLTEEYGHLFSGLVRIAHRHVNAITFGFSALKPIDVFEVALLSAEREDAKKRSNAGIKPGLRPVSELSFLRINTGSLALNDRIASLGYDAQVELKALVLLGRGDSGDDYVSALEYSKIGHDDHIPSYLASKQSLHRMLSDGLRMLGESGASVLALFPPMNEWSRYSEDEDQE